MTSNRPVTRLALITTLLAALFLLLVNAQSHASEILRDRTLVLGKVSASPKKNHRDLKPIVDYVVSQLGDLGLVEARVLIAKDNQQMMQFIEQGKVDWVTETIFSAAEFIEKANLRPLLVRHRSGVGEYHSVFFTHKDSSITDLEDLLGKSIAFEDPGSTTGFRLPAAILLEQGHEMVQLASPRDPVPADKIGFIFAKAEINISAWVSKGLVDAGAFSNLDWMDTESNPKTFRDNLTIIDRTADVPRALELVRKDLDPDISNRLQLALLNAHLDPAAREAMLAYRRATRFVAIETESYDSMERLNRLRVLLGSKLNL